MNAGTFLSSAIGPPTITEPPSYSSTTAAVATTNRNHGIATLDCCQLSHPFDDRRLILTEEPTKVGRAVARIKPQSDNAIFDCKVLSRNHALIWFEDGRFYLKDTKSSNGTFVNNQRLSKGSEESPPREIFSGDILQFGIDIMENSKKVTHGCIITLVRLFDRNSVELPGRSSVEPEKLMSSLTSSAISTQELYQLQQYIKEAAHREQQLEQKLLVLQNLLSSSHEAAENSWQALIDEDRLLSRIEMLESQLHTYSKSVSEDKLRDDLKFHEEHKHARENHAKEALRKALEEKTEFQQKLHDVESSLNNAEGEAFRFRSEWQFVKDELAALAEKHSTTSQDLQDSLLQIKEQETKYGELERNSCKEKGELETKILDFARQESILAAKVEALQNENDLAKEQIAALKIRVDRKVEDDAAFNSFIGSDESPSAVLLPSGTGVTGLVDTQRVENLRECIRDLQVQRETYKAQLEEAMKQKIAQERLSEMYKEQVMKLECDLQSRMTTEERFNQNANSPQAIGEVYKQNTLPPSLSNGDVHPPPPDPSKENGHHSATPESELARQVLEAKVIAETQLHSIRSQLSDATSKLARSQAEVQSLKAQISQGQRDKEASLLTAKESLQEQLEHEIELRKSLSEQLEQVRSRARSLNEELEFERSLRVNSALDTDSTRLALHRQAARSQVEFQELKEECARLKNRINAIESEITDSRKENSRLSSEYRRLQDSYRDLEDLRDTLESKESYPSSIFTYGSIHNGTSPTIGVPPDEGSNATSQDAGEDTPVMSSSLISQGLGTNLSRGHHDDSSNFSGTQFDFSSFDLSYEDFDYRTWSVAILSLMPILVLFLSFLMAWNGCFGSSGTQSGSGGSLDAITGSSSSTPLAPKEL